MFQLARSARPVVLSVGLAVGAISLLVSGQELSSAPPVRIVADLPNERHPHLRRPLVELREAKKELETADHDFGGHRVQSIKAINHAIAQLEKALKFDRK